VSEHALTYGCNTSLTGGGYFAECTCGWHSGFYGKHLADAVSKARGVGIAHERENKSPERHDTTAIEHSGDFVRVACECGHKGDWQHASAPSLQRRLHSDVNAHFWALKRMEA